MKKINLVFVFVNLVIFYSIMSFNEKTNGNIKENTFTVLTYNVAGLPEGISGSHPKLYTPQISPKLNSYDIVLVQEDFWYHKYLITRARHPYKSASIWEKKKRQNMGDGLNYLSNFPFGEVVRISWGECNGVFDDGSDCLTKKGFSFAEFELAKGNFVDIYNLHFEAGEDEEDIHSREIQTQQLINYISTHSSGKSVIVGGDFNMHDSLPHDKAMINKIIEEAGLQDSCQFLKCPVETIDKILFRGSNLINLIPLKWDMPKEFVDSKGNDLSDHKPVMVRFSWESK